MVPQKGSEAISVAQTTAVRHVPPLFFAITQLTFPSLFQVQLVDYHLAHEDLHILV